MAIKLNMKTAVAWQRGGMASGLGPFIRITNDDVLAVGIAIDDMTVENGCMLMVTRVASWRAALSSRGGRVCRRCRRTRFPAGSCGACHCQGGWQSPSTMRETLHASTPKPLYTASARLLLFQYCSIDSWPLLGVPDYEAYLKHDSPWRSLQQARGWTAVPVDYPSASAGKKPAPFSKCRRR